MLDIFRSVPWPVWAVIELVLLGVLGFIMYSRRKRPVEESEVADIAREPQTLPVVTISIDEIERDYRQRRESLDQRLTEIQARTKVLEQRTYEGFAPHDVLALGSREEKANLAAILKQSVTVGEQDLVKHLRQAGSHVVGRFVRKGQGVSYAKVVKDVARKLGVQGLSATASTWEIEQAIGNAAFQKMLSKASPEQREAILAEIQRSSRGSPRSIGATTAALAAANLSGFALYTAASTALGAVTSAAGVALPFAAYTGVSSVLATVTGPVGWAALGAWAVFKFGGVDYKKTIPAVMAIANVRTRLIAERDQELQALTAERETLHLDLQQLVRVGRFLDGLRHFGPEHRVPVCDVPALI